jgi:hypothetical protein
MPPALTTSGFGGQSGRGSAVMKCLLSTLSRPVSISYDIIVKQRSGSIEVDSQPREFPEIRVILPSVAVFV